MVRLFHRENECYVCAEGSFADDEYGLNGTNEHYTAPEESYSDGDVVQLFPPEKESADGSHTNGTSS